MLRSMFPFQHPFLRERDLGLQSTRSHGKTQLIKRTPWLVLKFWIRMRFWIFRGWASSAFVFRFAKVKAHQFPVLG